MGENYFPAPPIRRSPRKHASSASSLPHRPTPQRLQPRPTLPSSSDIIQPPYNDPPFRENVRLTCLYNFLLGRTVPQLRDICKPFRVISHNRKKDGLISSLILYFHIQSLEDVSISDCISRNQHLTIFPDWEKRTISRRNELSKLPDVTHFLHKLDEKDIDKVHNAILSYQNAGPSGFPFSQEPNLPNDPCFCLNEFARLIIILRDDEIAKNALQKANCTSLTKDELTANVTRESFWITISDRFNDPSVQTKENFTGRLDEVDSNAKPLCKRGADLLKDQYEKVKGVVTLARANWSKSGQNNPGNFTSFLKMNSTGKLDAASKRAFVFFIVSRIGTGNEAEELLVTTSKMIGGEDEGVEEGNLGGLQSKKAFSVRSGRMSGSRHSGSYNDIEVFSRTVERTNKIQEEQTSILRAQYELERQRSGGPSRTNEERQRAEFDHHAKLASSLAESSTALKRARDVHDEELAAVLEVGYSQILKKYKKVLDDEGFD